jgi:hypothetical protein
MPSKIHLDLRQAEAQAFNGVLAMGTALGTTMYLGLRNDTPVDSDTLSTLSTTEIVGGGYARVAITINSTNFPDSASGFDRLISILQQSFAAFTGTPTTNGATHWFLCNAASGTTGKLWASGPLQNATVVSTIQAAAAAGQAVISVTNAIAVTLNPFDYLYVGTGTTTGYAGDQERKQIATGGIGAANSGGAGFANITLSANLASAHASGEPVSRDCCVRTYASGYVEQVTPSLLFTTG